ncbi:PQQ-binding-like beta-propeller repeat protein [Brevibacillus laterosporus]|uniref:PQQ-binding-like beta-propeller repeat protein n=1 Tax=Brevibacillus laterosporus TaxID=1465 RepID=UPI0035A721BE
MAVYPTGKEKWRISLKEHAWGQFIIFNAALGADDTLYVASYEKLFAIGSDGTLKWVKTIEGKYILGENLLIGADGTLYWIGVYRRNQNCMHSFLVQW